MEYEKIKQLMEDMGNSKLTAIDIDFPDGTKISMKKETSVKVATPIVEPEASKEVTLAIEEKTVETSSQVVKGNVVKSPMVGTFYLKPSPTSESFVEVGKNVKKGDTLCIIEAMKLMNEIESEFEGKVKEILVKDGEAVEYGKPMFIIE